MFKKFYIFFFIITLLFQIIISLCKVQSSGTFSSDFIYPSDITYTSSEFGYRILYGKNNFHTGTDFPATQGSKVYATESGTIKSCGFVQGYGICVTILHPNNYISLYAHLDENVNLFVYIGKEVLKGEVIANVGPKYLSNGVLNGNTTGPHLHFTVYNEKGKLINPLSLNLKKKS